MKLWLQITLYGFKSTFTLKVLWKGWAQGFKIYEKITFALKDLWKGWALGLKIFDVEVVGERTDSAILT